MTNEHPDAAESMTMAELYFGDGSRPEETDCGLAVLREYRAFREGCNPFPSYSDEELEERWTQVASVIEGAHGEEPPGADEPPEGEAREVPEDVESGDAQPERATADGREPDGVLVGDVHEVWFVPRDDTGWQQHQETWHERFELDLMTADGSSAAVLEARAPRAGKAARHHWFLQLKCTTTVTVAETSWDEDRVTRSWLRKLKRTRQMRAPEPELLFVVMLPPCSLTFPATAHPALAWSSPPPLGGDTGAEGNIRLPVPAAVLCVAQREESKWFEGSADAAFLAVPERLSPVRDHLPDLRAYWHSTLHQRLPERLKLPCRE
ncbi:hypothetical protein ACFY30_34385 [Streptomyces sp. NPDC000345]|uniref:hypothetical protein n=1 Tax=Streptomyces sp. NPDC000345 TaxID=3364537 RepID=UPI0036A695D0